MKIRINYSRMSDRETSDRENESGESDNETQPQVGSESN